MLWISMFRFSCECKFSALLHTSSSFKPEVWAPSSTFIASIILHYARDNFRWLKILTYFSIFIIQVSSSWFYQVYQNCDMRNLFPPIFLKFMWLFVWCYSMNITLNFAIRPVLSRVGYIWRKKGEARSILNSIQWIQLLLY